MKKLLTIISLLSCLAINAQKGATINIIENESISKEYRDKNCTKCEYSRKPNANNISVIYKDEAFEFKIRPSLAILTTITKDFNIKLLRKDFTESDLLRFKTKKFTAPVKKTISGTNTKPVTQTAEKTTSGARTADTQAGQRNPGAQTPTTATVYQPAEKTEITPGYFSILFEENLSAKDNLNEDYYILIETSRSSDKKKDIRLYSIAGRDLQQLKNKPTLLSTDEKPNKPDKTNKPTTKDSKVVFIANPEGPATSSLSQLPAAPAKYPIPGKPMSIKKDDKGKTYLQYNQNIIKPIINRPLNPTITNNSNSNFGVYINNTPNNATVENTTFLPISQWLANNGKNTFTYYLGDFNGDKMTDLCIEKLSANGDEYLFDVALSNGSGFSAPSNWGKISKRAVGSEHFVKIGDANGDRNDDVIFISFGNGTRMISTLLSTGNNMNTVTVAQASSTTVKSERYYVIGNFNSTNGIDIAYLDNNTSSIMCVSGLNNGAFSPYATQLNKINSLTANEKSGTAKDIFEIHVGDVNGDSYDDIIAFTNKVNSTSKIQGCVFVCKSGWVPSASVSNPSRVDYNSISLWNGGFCFVNEEPLVGDFNGDNKDDIATYVKSRGEMCFSYSNGNSFEGVGQCKLTNLNGNADYLTRVSVGYLNNDKKADIIIYKDNIKDLKPVQKGPISIPINAFITPPIKLTTTVTKNNANTELKGPNYASETIPLIDIINIEDNVDKIYKENSDNGSLNLADICGINIELTPDINIESGTLYYKPDAYNIKFNQKNSRYDFSARLVKAKDEEETTETKFQLKLKPSFDENDDTVLVSLVKAYMVNNPNVIKGNNIKINPYPLQTAEYRQINNIGITDITSITVEDIKDDITLNFITKDDVIRDGYLNVVLDDSDMSGNSFGEIKFTQGNSQPNKILVNMSLLSKQTLGLIKVKNDWIANSNVIYTNPFPVPIRPKFLHALFIVKDDNNKLTPVIYSWNFGKKNDYLKPGQSSTLNLQSIPSWLKNSPDLKKAWIDYDIITKPINVYQTYKDNLRDTLMIETLKKDIVKCNVKLLSTKAFAGGKIMQIRVIVKSKYFDMKNKVVKESPITGYLTSDQLALECTEPLYFSNKDNLPADIPVQYVVEVVLTDTEETKTSAPQSGILKGRNELVITINDMKRIFPDIQFE